MILFTFNTILIQSESKKVCPPVLTVMEICIHRPTAGTTVWWPSPRLHSKCWETPVTWSFLLFKSTLSIESVYVCERWTGEKNDDKSTSKDPGLKYEISNISLQKLFSQLYSIGDVNWRIYNKLLPYKWFLTLNMMVGKSAFCWRTIRKLFSFKAKTLPPCGESVELHPVLEKVLKHYLSGTV